jgi:HAD superfamily 5'-nucleotidase-like hydrolase
MLVAWNGTLSDQIRTCLDYFDMPAALAFARIVDSIDAEKGGKQEKYVVWPDILAGLISMYSRELFNSTDSKYFSELRANPSKYLYKCDPKVMEWLRGAKKEKKTFLVTGSHIDFASFTSNYAMGPNWRELFDVVICYAKKPGFFTMNRPFMQLDGIKETDPVCVADLKPNSVYAQGNFTELKVFLSRLCNKETPKIVYVGDNLIQDVFTPSYHSGIDTVAIVEEMMCEGVDFIEEYEILRSSVWGSYFHTNGENTLWENIVRRHAKICVPAVYEFCKNPIDYEYTAFDPQDNSIVGYYPHDPFDPYVAKE